MSLEEWYKCARKCCEIPLVGMQVPVFMFLHSTQLPTPTLTSTYIINHNKLNHKSQKNHINHKKLISSYKHNSYKFNSEIEFIPFIWMTVERSYFC